MRYALQYNVICLENIILHWHTSRALRTWKSFWPSRIQCVFHIPKLITFIPAFFSAELVLEVGVACHVLQSRPLSSRCGLFFLCYDLTRWTRGRWTVVKKAEFQCSWGWVQKASRIDSHSATVPPIPPACRPHSWTFLFAYLTIVMVAVAYFPTKRQKASVQSAPNFPHCAKALQNTQCGRWSILFMYPHFLLKPVVFRRWNNARAVVLPGRICRPRFVGAVPDRELLECLRAVSWIVHPKRLHLYFLFTEDEKLTQTAVDTSRVARAQAVDARMNKQGPPPTLHTTSGLSAAKTNNNPTNENKIFISLECRLKSASRREQNYTDPDCGRWGKPWAKDDYLSGKTFLACHHTG